MTRHLGKQYTTHRHLLYVHPLTLQQDSKRWIAHINVGAQETPFDVHLELLCDCSPYFDSLYKDRTALNITEDPVCLPDEDPDVFTEIVGWMYQGELSPDLPSRVKSLFLFKLWVLAGKFEILELQNAAISLCKIMADNKPSAVHTEELVNYVYTHTLLGSPLRRFVVDTFMQRATMQQLLARKDNLPRAFLEELCASLIGRIESAGINRELKDSVFKARYYVHPPTERCGRGEPFRFGAPGEVPQLATPDQMQDRRLKSPSSQIRRSSRRSSPSVMTPGSATVDGEPKDTVTDDMKDLKV